MIYYINCILTPFKLVGFVVSSPQQAQHFAWQDQQQFQQQDGWATDRTLFKRKISFTFKASNETIYLNFEGKWGVNPHAGGKNSWVLSVIISVNNFTIIKTNEKPSFAISKWHSKFTMLTTTISDPARTWIFLSKINFFPGLAIPNFIFITLIPACNGFCCG